MGRVTAILGTVRVPVRRFGERLPIFPWEVFEEAEPPCF